jgi:hypothetical protein
MAAKTAAERKKDQRAREKKALEKLGGRRIQFITYGATLAKLEAISAANGFTGKQKLGEALTFLVENHKL